MSKNIYKVIVPISGMHCRSCEMLIEDKLSEIPEVTKSTVDHKRGVAEIYCGEQKPNQNEVHDAIRSAGYDIGSNSKKSFINRNISDYKDLGIAFLFLIGLYFVLKSLGLTSINLGSFADNPSGIYAALLVGLVAGFSTCMALVGGLVLGISARHAEKHPEATVAQKFRPHLYFIFGRIAGFSFLGGMLGALGSFLQISTLVLGIFTILVGIVMLLIGLQLIEISPALNGIKITIPKFISRALGMNNHQVEYSHRGSMAIGALTFFLPCGFTQAMQLYAVSTGSFARGAAVMGLFAIGTAPGLLGVGGITSAVKGIFAKRFFKFAGLLVISFAIFNIANGYNLTGWQAGGGTSDSVSTQGGLADDSNVVVGNGVQTVKMQQLANGYSPNHFTIKKGVPVKWVVDSVDPYSCASTVNIPKLNITKHLVKGENTIEFTPNEAGALKFSCSMGMYTGVFNVVDDSGAKANPTDPNLVASASADSSAAAKPSGSSCGGGPGGCGCGCGSGAAKAVTPQEGTVEQSNDNAPTPNGNSNSPQTNSPGGVSQVQVIKTSFTVVKDISPNTFTVKVGVPVKFVIDAKEDGAGCMSAIMIPGVYEKPKNLVKGTVEMDFTPKKTGEFSITCAMGVPRGTLKVQ